MLATTPVPIELPIRDGKPGINPVKDNLNGKNEPSRGTIGRSEWSADAGRRKDLRENIPVARQLKSVKARNFSPADAILRRYFSRKSSTEETMLHLYHGNISVGKAEELAAQLWGSNISLPVLVRSARMISRRIDAWLQRELVVPQVYVFLQSIEIKQKSKSARKASVIATAVGVDRDGTRQLLAVARPLESSADLWPALFSDLKKRGLHGAELFIGEIDPALRSAAAAYFPGVAFQGCLLDMKHEIQRRVEGPQVGFVWQAFDKIKSSSKQQETLKATNELLDFLQNKNRSDVVDLFKSWTATQYSYLNFTQSHWNRLRDVGPFKQVLRDFRETIRVIGPVADDKTLLLMAAAKFRSMEKVKWAEQPFVTFDNAAKSGPAPVRPVTPKLKRAS